MLRITKILLIAAVALWGFISAFLNIIDWSGTLRAVTAATSMATFEGAADWKATSNPAVIWVGSLFILLSKIGAAILCLIGLIKMWSVRKADAATFQSAKKFALTGCTVAVFMLFSGFIVVAESWFELWRSDVMRGPVLESAFRYGGMIALIALIVGAQDD